MLPLFAAMFGYASPAWPNRVPPRLAVQGDNDDDKPWRAFTASHKLKGRGRNGKGTDRKVKARTGYDPKQLDVVWEQVKAFLPRPKRAPHNTKAMFFLAFCFIHSAPRINNICTLYSPTVGFLTKDLFYDRVVPILKATAEHIDLIRWENR